MRTGNCLQGQALKDCLKPVQINLEQAYGIKNSVDNSDNPLCEEIKTTHMAPLGWYTSTASAMLIRRSSGVMIDYVCLRAGITGCLVAPPTVALR